MSAINFNKIIKYKFHRLRIFTICASPKLTETQSDYPGNAAIVSLKQKKICDAEIVVCAVRSVSTMLYNVYLFRHVLMLT